MQKIQQRWFYISIVIIAITVFAAQSCKKGEAKFPEGTVAVVNGTIITQDEFNTELTMMQKQFASQGQVDPEQLASMRKEVLEGIINRKVLYQESQKKGIEVDDVAVNGQLATIKKQFPAEGSFEKMLEGLNLTEDSLKIQLRSGVAIQKLIEQEVMARIEISDKETKDYYDKNPDLFKQPEKIQARHILIKVEEGASEADKAEALKKIKGIQKEFKAGGDFVELAKKHSECPSSSNGGDLGFFARGQMVQPFEDVAFSLKTGETSDVVETRFGYHLIQVGDKQPETISEYKDVKDKLAPYLKRMNAGEEAKKYIESLKKAAKIERFLPVAEKQDKAE
ncbi:MAG: peptidylprolyl isomerase [Syntrophobacterales bacterium]|nr:MAG: peptidylprolyl isomerase [Syntrophobacterales bacterium]